MQNHRNHTEPGEPRADVTQQRGLSRREGRKGKSFSQDAGKCRGLKPAAAAYQRELRGLQPGGRRCRLAHGLEQRGPQRTVVISADLPYGGELLRYLFVALGESIRDFKTVVIDFRESFIPVEKHAPFPERLETRLAESLCQTF